MERYFPVYQPNLSGNELKYVTDCVNSGWISSLGNYVPLFEEKFAAFCHVKHAIAVSNGTAALHLALLLCDIGPGDEVIIPALTFIATANAVHYTGANPVFVDSDLQSWNLDHTLIEEKITPNTKAIIPVHLYGHPADMGAIMEIADKYNLFVIEDAAEAHGAEYLGKRTGGLGHIGAFSFYGNKIITTGEGGMLTTNDDELASKARLLKDHGMSTDRHYWHPVVGYNYRMTNIQASIGVAQLESVRDTIVRKIEVANLYNEGLAECPGLILPPQASWAMNVYWMYSILVTEECAFDREQLRSAMRDHGIDSRPFFIPINQMPPYKNSAGSYNVADYLSKHGINLPSYPTLKDSHVEYICEVIRNLCSG